MKEFGHILQGPLNNPGPGTYKSLKIDARSYSMSPKTDIPWVPCKIKSLLSRLFKGFLKKRDYSFLIPGPGTY